MKPSHFAATFLIVLPLLCACHTAKGNTPTEKRTYVQDMKKSALDELYKTNPGVQADISRAAGYGVFSAMESGIFLITTGNGYGVVVNNKTGKNTYMKLGALGAGIGMGIKNVKKIFVFPNEKSMTDFVEKGMQIGADADAAAKAKGKGLAMGAQAEAGSGSGSVGLGSLGSAGSGVQVYELTQWGAAFRASATGRKYWKDDKLNE